MKPEHPPIVLLDYVATWATIETMAQENAVLSDELLALLAQYDSTETATICQQIIDTTTSLCASVQGRTVTLRHVHALQRAHEMALTYLEHQKNR